MLSIDKYVFGHYLLKMQKPKRQTVLFLELKKKGWSFRRLAQETRLDPSFISYVARGKKGLSLESALKISRALNIDIASLAREAA